MRWSKQLTADLGNRWVVSRNLVVARYLRPLSHDPLPFELLGGAKADPEQRESIISALCNQAAPAWFSRLRGRVRMQQRTTKPVKKPWVKPVLKRIEAGSAELAAGPTADGPNFS